MPTPFPGMDPYLARRGLREDVHTRLVVAISDALAPQVRPTDRVVVEQLGVCYPIPDTPIPLRRGETEPTLSLNQVLHDLYDRAGYDLAVDYGQPAEPPLDAADAAWATQLVAQRAQEGGQ